MSCYSGVCNGMYSDAMLCMYKCTCVHIDIYIYIHTHMCKRFQCVSNDLARQPPACPKRAAMCNGASPEAGSMWLPQCFCSPVGYWWWFSSEIVLQHRNPSRMLNSGNIFLTILIWFWIRFDDMNLICFEFGVMISIWVLLCFWYDFDTILIWFWYSFGMILIRLWYGSSELVSKKETETAQGHVFGRAFNGFYGLGVILIWFWYDFDTILVWFWFGSSELASKKETKTAQGQVFGRFAEGFCGFDTILIRFWYDFDTVLIRFWYDFDTILIRFWYGFDMVLEYFGYGSDGLASNHKFDPHQES